jgi:hypothetical protein
METGWEFFNLAENKISTQRAFDVSLLSPDDEQN